MTINTFFHCAINDLCDTANDTIQIRIKDGFKDEVVFQLDKRNGRKDRKWVNDEFFFQTKASKIIVYFFLK